MWAKNNRKWKKILPHRSISACTNKKFHTSILTTSASASTAVAQESAIDTQLAYTRQHLQSAAAQECCLLRQGKDALHKHVAYVMMIIMMIIMNGYVHVCVMSVNEWMSV